MNKMSKSHGNKLLTTIGIIVAAIIGIIAIMVIGYFTATLIKAGIKAGFKTAGNSFQFDVDASEAHGELAKYYKANGAYPTDQTGIGHSKFSYNASPANCDNQTVVCTGYTITHKDYKKSQTNTDYKPAKNHDDHR